MLLRQSIGASAKQLCLLIALATCATSAFAQPAAAPAPLPDAALVALIPTQAADFTPERADEVAKAARAVESWVAELAEFHRLQTPREFVVRIDQLHGIKDRVDQALEQTLALRGTFGPPPGDSPASSEDDSPDAPQRPLVRSYLQTTSALIDLAGRIRYSLFDAVGAAAAETGSPSPEFDQLTAVLVRRRSTIGAMALLPELFVQPESNNRRVLASALAAKLRLLQLMETVAHPDLGDRLAALARHPQAPSEMRIGAIAAIRAAGVPQLPRPGDDPTLPKQATSARELAQILERIAPGQLSPPARAKRDELLAWLTPRLNGLGNATASEAIGETAAEANSETNSENDFETYRLGAFDIRPGDWLLMRNPSPYNRFTDLGPGLFTHVGVITSETAGDGVRRMVVIDLPEEGQTMRTTNVDTYVKRTLHYVVLRHRDEAACAKMAEVARQLIGNPTQFDLNFRTDRLEALRGQPLAGRRIHTYCAGLLMLCAQETDRPRSEFFPFVEYAAAGHTRENLARFGMSFGDRFVSPTGALFSPQLEIVARREPMYNPRREAEEAIYDSFAQQLAAKPLNPGADAFDDLRLKLAEAGKANPLLAKALAGALDVSDGLDLVAAAKAAAVIQSLDAIARDAGTGYEHSRAALIAGPESGWPARGLTAQDMAVFRAYRERHADLLAKWEQGALTPRALRRALVKYYIDKQTGTLTNRFFDEAEPKPAE